MFKGTLHWEDLIFNNIWHKGKKNYYPCHAIPFFLIFVLMFLTSYFTSKIEYLKLRIQTGKNRIRLKVATKFTSKLPD